MTCPECKRDYRDVLPGRVPGKFYDSDDHWYKTYRRYGIMCGNCGFVAEAMTTITGDPYRKRDVKKDENTLDMFEQENTELAAFQDEIGLWHLKTFPGSTINQIAAKLVEEAKEVKRNPEDAAEWADTFIVVLAGCYKKGIDLLQAAKEKLIINKKQNWKTNRSGLPKHVKEKVK